MKQLFKRLGDIEKKLTVGIPLEPRTYRAHENENGSFNILLKDGTGIQLNNREELQQFMESVEKGEPKRKHLFIIRDNVELEVGFT